ncbi:MAG: DinB family protein [Gemmatimonadaceae bacterium]
MAPGVPAAQLGAMGSSGHNERQLAHLLADHQAAVREFVDRANALPGERWLLPRAEGKWTPAQETRHLILFYEALAGDLRNERQMRVYGTPFKRRIWRWFALTQILWRKRIPVAVRAPREARPEGEDAPRHELLALFQDRAGQFDDLLAENWRQRPDHRVMHPWFGGLTLDHAARLSSVHTRHHAAFLRVPASS